MKIYQTILSSIFLTIILACNSGHSDDKSNHIEWKTIILPNGWELQTPENFKDSTGQGTDSNPGHIYSDSEDIVLQFDCGRDMILREDCDFNKQIIASEKEITEGFYKDYYKVPILHKAYIDTIDNKVATIVTPTEIGKGTVSISISDCKSGFWTGIKGENLSGKDEKLILKIFKTLKRNN
jgi:hypothetical protein